MSGGYFEYKQHQIGDIIEKLEAIIEKAENPDKCCEKEEDDRYYFEVDCECYDYIKETIDKFKEGLEALKKAKVYTRRIDWLLSGDDSEETFLKRLADELSNL